MNLYVQSFATNDDLEKAIASVRALSETLTPNAVSLSNQTRKNLRVIGTSRLGLVEIVNGLSIQYNDKLAKNDQALDLNQRLAYLRLMLEYKMAIGRLYELVDDTTKALSNDVMAFVDKFSNTLRNARRFDGDLDENMKELDNYNARFGKMMESEDGETENNTTDTATETSQ